MKRITIKKNFYFSAGHKHGWKNVYDVFGVGIRLDALRENTELELVINDKLYTINCAQAITFIKTYKSVETFKGIKVGIVSRSLLNKVQVPKEEVVENKVLQSSLF